MSSLQIKGLLALHTSREGDVEAPCTGFVRKETLTDGTEVVIGDVMLNQENTLLLEPTVAALTEHMRNEMPAAYSGHYFLQPHDDLGQTEAIECNVRIVALAGKDFRFTTEKVLQTDAQAEPD